jgi:hypothetical protein
LTGKYFLLTTFSNGKQTQKNLKNNFSKTTFHKTNMTLTSLSFPPLKKSTTTGLAS